MKKMILSISILILFVLSFFNIKMISLCKDTNYISNKEKEIKKLSNKIVDLNIELDKVKNEYDALQKSKESEIKELDTWVKKIEEMKSHL